MEDIAKNVQSALDFIRECKVNMEAMPSRIAEARTLMGRAVELEQYDVAAGCRDIIKDVEDKFFASTNIMVATGKSCEGAERIAPEKDLSTIRESVGKIKWELQNIPTL
jgi:hypothetical protein